MTPRQPQACAAQIQDRSTRRFFVLHSFLVSVRTPTLRTCYRVSSIDSITAHLDAFARFGPAAITVTKVKALP